MAIGRDLYNDTRLIISKLEQLYPTSPEHPSISSFTPDQKVVEQLLDRWIIDGGVFTRIVQLMPPSMPLLKDSNFVKDREQLTGRSFGKETLERGRPDALAETTDAFSLLEALLADGRNWIVGTEELSLADIRAVWAFYWATVIPGALPPDQISAVQFPKVFAWIERFSAAAKQLGRPKNIEGSEAVKLITSSEYVEGVSHVQSHATEGFHAGQGVEVWPIDSGFNNKDRGILLALTISEIVIEKKTDQGQTIRMHAPRHGFRIRPLRTESLL